MKAPPDDVVAAAQAAQRAHGVPASVSIGQWALESAWGSKCTGRFNFFGVKALKGQMQSLCWTHEVVGGKTISCQQPFRDYASLNEAFDDHAAMLTGHRYAKAWPCRGVAQFVTAIGPVYATDPHYAASLFGVIHDDGLMRYDLPLAA
jgi:flagellum-specific peptidoglycan hydrolase FlgJ